VHLKEPGNKDKETKVNDKIIEALKKKNGTKMIKP